MADSKKQGKHTNKVTIKHGKGKKDELTEKQLDHASGGGSQRTSGIA